MTLESATKTRTKRAGTEAKPRQVPPSPKAPDDNEIRLLLAPALSCTNERGGKLLIPTIPLNVAHFEVAFHGTGKYVVCLPSWTSLRQDAQVFQALNSLPPRLCDDPHQKALRKMLSDTDNYLATFGTPAAWLSRFVKGMLIPYITPPWRRNSTVDSTILANKFIEELISWDILSFRRSKRTSGLLTEENPHDRVQYNLDVNWESRAGPAYNNRKKSDPDVINSMKQIVDQIAKHLRSIGDPYYKNSLPSVDALITWMFQKKPLWVSCFLTPKMEIYETKPGAILEMEKVRPYYVFNYHFVYLFSPIISSMKKKMTSFLESGSWAVGFSYAHGGSSNFVNWIKNTPLHQVRAAVYADDNTWVFNVRGHLVMKSPDIVIADNHVHRDRSLTFMAVFDQLFPNASRYYRNCAILLSKMAFTHIVILYHAHTYLKTDKLFTGAVGTTEFDELLSFEMVYLLKTLWSDFVASDKYPPRDCTSDAALKAVDIFMDQFLPKLNWVTLKPETITSWLFRVRKDTAGNSLPTFVPQKFLGFYQYIIGETPDGDLISVPTQEPLQLIKTLVFPSAPSKEEPNSLTLSRMYQIVFNGCYLYPCIYNALALRFNTLLSTVGYTAPDEKGEAKPVHYTVLFHALPQIQSVPDLSTIWEKSKRFPTRQECFELFVTAPKDAVYYSNFNLVSEVLPTSSELDETPLSDFSKILIKNQDFLFSEKVPHIPAERSGQPVRRPKSAPGTRSRGQMEEPTKLASASKALTQKGEKTKRWAEMVEEEEIYEAYDEEGEKVPLSTTAQPDSEEEYEERETFREEYEEDFVLERRGKKGKREVEEESEDDYAADHYDPEEEQRIAEMQDLEYQAEGAAVSKYVDDEEAGLHNRHH